MPTKPQHILVVRLSAMGDVAMTIPVLRAFAQQYPHVKITVLTRAFFAPFFRDIANVTVYAANVKGKHKGIKGIHKLAQELKKLKITAVADLHNVLRSNLLKLFLRNLPFKQLNKGRSEKKALISGSVFKQLTTTHQRYATVFKELGYPVDLQNPKFPHPVLLSKPVVKITRKKEGVWIGIAPFAAHESKMYPLPLMQQVVTELAKTYKVFLFGGGAEEVKLLEQFENENIVSLAGKLTLNGELDVISNLDVMLSMDSGNAHIAAMLGIKVITTWGVTHPYVGFAPFNQPSDYCLTANRETYPKIPTSIYGNKYPKDYKEAAGSILPTVVIEKVKEVVNT